MRKDCNVSDKRATKLGVSIVAIIINTVAGIGSGIVIVSAMEIGGGIVIVSAIEIGGGIVIVSAIEIGGGIVIVIAIEIGGRYDVGSGIISLLHMVFIYI